MKNTISKSNNSIFKECLLPNNSNIQNYELPSLILKQKKRNAKRNDINIGVSFSNSNLSKKNNNKMLLNSKITSFTNYNVRNSHTIEVHKSYELSKTLRENKTKPKVKLEKDKEKLQNLVDCFKELDNTNPKTKYEIKNLKEINNNIYNKEISNTFTKFYKINRHQQKLDVIKLNTWDEDNLASFYGNTNIIYNYLVSYFIKKNDKSKLNELEYFKRIIDSNGNFVDNLLKTTNPNNKIIKNFREQKNLEEGTILHNIISKTHNRFRYDLLIKDKKITLNFGLDSDAYSAMKKEKDMGTAYYGKVIKEKEKQENAKREELMNLSIKILNKKKEKEIIENNIGKNYEETNLLIKRYNGEIIKIKDEIHDANKLCRKLSHFGDVNGEDPIKIAKKEQAIVNRDRLEIQLIKIRHELNSEIKKMDQKRNILIEKLEILKNELLFMKIAHIYLTKEQRNYYLDLLNKGYDIRKDGLVWIVKRLLEIQTKLEYHHFPKYLDKDQADYIIELANINLEEAQLKIVIDVLQKKQMNKHNQFNKQMIKKLIVLSKKRQTKLIEENLAKNKSPKKEEKCNLEDKIYNSIHDIYKKYENAFQIKNLRKFDDLRDKQIIDELKNSLLEGGRNGTGDNLDELAGLIEFLNNNGDKKDYFEFILKLKLRMRLLSKKKEELKQKQVFLFRESLDNDNRFNYAESSLKYDLVWGALFGNRFIS